MMFELSTRLMGSILLLACAGILAQDAPTPLPVAGAPNLMRLEGIDSESGVHYVRLLLSLPKAADATQAPPRFTVECTDNKGKHDLLWFLSFGGVDSYQFDPPFRPTQNNLFPPQYPSVRLKMTFEGYTKWKPFIKEWAVLPSGELRYRNAGMDSKNMETARYFLPYLNSLPGLRIGYAKPAKDDPAEVFFQTRPLLDELKKTPVCEP